MSAFTAKFVSSYLLMPLLAIIFGFLAVLIAKKNKLLSSKKLIIYMLISAILLALPGFLGIFNYDFMPYLYITLQVIYLILGIYNIKLTRSLFPDLEDKPFYVHFLLSFVVAFIGAAFFSLVFNIFNELEYGLWACTCIMIFMFPILFSETYKKYLSIPIGVYKIWKYSNKEDLSPFEMMNYDKLMVIEIEIFKNITDKAPTKIKAKTPEDIPFGVWFQKFLHDYNIKFPSNPIEVGDRDKEYGWVFYYKQSFFHFRKYLDHDMTVSKNKIKEKYIIVAKRVLEETAIEEGIATVKDMNN